MGDPTLGFARGGDGRGHGRRRIHAHGRLTDIEQGRRVARRLRSTRLCAGEPLRRTTQRLDATAIFWRLYPAALLRWLCPVAAVPARLHPSALFRRAHAGPAQLVNAGADAREKLGYCGSAAMTITPSPLMRKGHARSLRTRGPAYGNRRRYGAMNESSYKTDTNVGNFGWFGINIFYRVKVTGQAIGIARLLLCCSLLAELARRRWRSCCERLRDFVRMASAIGLLPVRCRVGPRKVVLARMCKSLVSRIEFAPLGSMPVRARRWSTASPRSGIKARCRQIFGEARHDERHPYIR
jgi:hypothetical protein